MKRPHGLVFKQRVIYEFKALHCSKCHMFGHLSSRCMNVIPTVAPPVPGNVNLAMSRSSTITSAGLDVVDNVDVVSGMAAQLPRPGDPTVSTNVSSCQVGSVQVTLSTNKMHSPSFIGAAVREPAGVLVTTSLPHSDGGQVRRKKQLVQHRNEASTSTTTTGYALRTTRGWNTLYP